MTNLTLDQASQIVDAALGEARRRDFRPIIALVLDAGGYAKAMKREDGAGLLHYDIAMGKAWGAVAMGSASRAQGERMEQRPGVVAAIAAASGGRYMPIPGGVLIRTANGELIGAIGVSGELSDNDEICAVAGIVAAGLIADTGQAT
ncbi:MAG: heme-binding protein [Alphaproteobacteria bacterium]|nr:heme-binding protein [Alphaproteobacteria bacterium]